MESNTTTPTIAEIWRKFQLSCKDVAFYRQLNGTLQSIEAKKIAAAEANFTALRAQLIERCHIIKDVTNRHTVISISIGSGPLLSMTVDENCDEDAFRRDSPHTAREMSAAYAFWAWELEQRQKESQEAPI